MKLNRPRVFEGMGVVFFRLPSSPFTGTTMGYSTNDCKALLDRDEQTKGTNQGPWKRLSKRNGADGVERIFSDKVGQRFVLVVETAQGLKVQATAATLEQLNQGASPSTVQGTAQPTDRFLETDAKLVAYADQVVRNLVAYEDVNEGSRAFEKAHRAIANRFLFGVDSTEGDTVLVTFVPDIGADGEGDVEGVPDYGLPIGSIVPNPEMSESPNDSGHWFIGGFDGDIKACVQALMEAGFRWDARVQGLASDPQGTAWVAQWVEQGLAGGQAQLQQVRARESTFTLDTCPKLTQIAELQTLLTHKTSTIMILTMDPQQITDEAFWGQLRKLGPACGFDVYLIPAGSPLTKAQEQIDGPLKNGQWRKALFARGQRVDKALEDMLTGLFDDLVQRHSQAPSRPKPR